ncbi:MAG: DUF484 family protein [Alphaproteobacteria bacterium]|nr:DUF484 family protein [Alphaproteobacteria bacterium]
MMPETAPPSESLSSESVAAWLTAHPDFFRRNPDVLESMDPPEQRQGRKVADFQYYMTQRARADRNEILSEAREIVETSRANMNNQARIHESVLRLLDAHSFDELIQTVTMDLATILNVDIITLLIETDGATLPRQTYPGVRVAARGTIEHLTDKQDVILESDISGTELLYGEGAGLVRSHAVLRLQVGPDTPPALIAFGSRDPRAFEKGQATDQVQFLARTTEKILRLWLQQ